MTADEIPVDMEREIPVILALHHDVHNAADAMRSKGFCDLITISGFSIYLRRSGFSGIELIPVADPKLLESESADIDAVRLLWEDDRSREIFQHYIDYLHYGKLDDLEHKDPGIMYYLENRPFEFRGNVTMADCGAFTGDSIIPLLPFIDFKKIYAFDPDPMIAGELHKNLSQCENLSFQVIQAGVGERDEILCFQPDGTGRGAVTDKGELKINITALDTVFKDTQVDFVKMDIEGAEAAALNGAREIIKRDMPLLEICVYHRWGDFWKLPLLIKKLNPEYSFYLRCNDDSFHDTVVVAVPERFKLR